MNLHKLEEDRTNFEENSYGGANEIRKNRLWLMERLARTEVIGEVIVKVALLARDQPGEGSKELHRG